MSFHTHKHTCVLYKYECVDVWSDRHRRGNVRMKIQAVQRRAAESISTFNHRECLKYKFPYNVQKRCFWMLSSSLIHNEVVFCLLRATTNFFDLLLVISFHLFFTLLLLNYDSCITRHQRTCRHSLSAKLYHIHRK